jgi:hypothetical protein
MKGHSLGMWRRWQEKSASLSRRPKGKKKTPRRLSVDARLETLEPRELLTVTYNGGALLTNVQAQAVYLGSAWNTNASLQSQTTQTDQFLSTLTSGAYMNMLSGYNVGTGTDTKGVVDGVNLASNSTLNDSTIQFDLAGLINSGKVQAPNANNLYMVYVEPSIVVKLGSASSKTYFLGYHGAFNDNGTDIHYAVMPYPGSPNPSPGSQGFASTFDELTAVSSHELAEAVTDPNVNYKTLGWYDYQLNGEIADLANGQTSTISGNGTSYVVADVVNQNDQVITPSSGSTGGGGGGGGTGGGGGGTTGSLSAPTVTASAVSSTVAQLKWGAVSGAQGYNVYFVSGGQDYYLGTVGPNTTGVQVTGLAAGSTDSFMVEAYNNNDTPPTADSSVVTVTLPQPVVPTHVTAPQNVTVNLTSATTALLSWTDEAAATGYNIYWSNGYQVLFLGRVSASTSSVTITGLPTGATSYFLVEAFNNTSYADSQWVYVTTPFYSASGNSGYGGYAGQQYYGGWWSAGSSPSIAGTASGGEWGRGRY